MPLANPSIMSIVQRDIPKYEIHISKHIETKCLHAVIYDGGDDHDWLTCCVTFHIRRKVKQGG